MARQARDRFRDAIAEGRLKIHTGDAASLPFDEGTFDKVSATHVVYFWPDQNATVGELRRVLRPGGVLAVGYQEQDRMPPRAARGLAAAGARLVGPGDVEDMARRAGFGHVRVETRPGDRGPSGFCMLATK
jgi:SAM-dependent methyltransferase